MINPVSGFSGRQRMERSTRNQSPIPCLQCGKCCLADMSAIVSQIENDDRDRWQREGRHDIIHILENEDPVWVGDHLISGKTGRLLHGCPFLIPEKDRFSCSIYETRPAVCRAFIPGSSEICPQCKK